MSSPPDLIVFVYTGDRKHSGTDSNIHLILYSDDGEASKTIDLNNRFSNDFENGQIDTFKVSHDCVEGMKRFVKVKRLQLWKDLAYGLFEDAWFVDKIVVENTATNVSFVFPIFRWIKSRKRYYFCHLDTFLPQFDPCPEQRKQEMEEKKAVYQFKQGIPGGLVQVKNLPPDEQFSFDHKWDFTVLGISVKTSSFFFKLRQKKFTSLEDVETIFDGNVFKRPSTVDRWKSDVEFGRQRTCSINPTLIQRVDTMPENFPVTDDLLGPLLEGLTIEQALGLKKLFICDLNILEGIPLMPGLELCVPLALFFVNEKKQLVPIAIQLFQKPGPENPIFTPLDDPMLWIFVKMWYNNADCIYHQSLTHLALTHQIMEGVAIAANRNLSLSHPMYKVMAPHFLYVIAINWKAMKLLVSKGGWVDQTMTHGSQGMIHLTVKGFQKWRLNVEGTLPEDLKNRGVDDPNVLPGYRYRDDALLIYNAIKNYVTAYVDLYYTSDEILQEDLEIQAFVAELAKERNHSEGGVGMKGVPGDGKLTSKKELVSIVTSIIYICSVAHASANFGQYDEYAYPPSYPSILKGKPPNSKTAKVTEADFLANIADESTAHSVLVVTKILSTRGTNSLGDFEVQYIFDPKAKKLVDQLRNELEEISKIIHAKNAGLDVPYDDLLPEDIPNSISI